MFNLSDSELDRLSRKAAEAYEVETNSSSWGAMEKMLDKEFGPASHPVSSPPRSFRFPFAYTSIVVLVVGAAYFFLSQPKKKDIKDQGSYVTNSAKPSDNKSPSIGNSSDRVDAQSNAKIETQKTVTLDNTKNKNDINSTLTNNNKATTNGVSDKTTEAKIENKAPSSRPEKLNKENLGQKDNTKISKNGTRLATGLLNKKAGLEKASSNEDKTDVAILSDAHVGNNKAASNLNKIGKAKKEKRVLGDKNIAGNKKSPTDFSEPINSENGVDNAKSTAGALKNENKQQAESPKTEDMTYAPLQQVAHASSHPSFKVSDSALIAEAEKLKADHSNFPGKKNRSLTIKRPLQIGVSFAPDFSKVRYAYDNSRLGSTFGLTLSYEIIHRLSVNTGIIYANKYYKASEDNFHLQRSMVAAAPNYEVEFLDASCKMFDIPLNLRYDISLEGNTRFFVSSGLSSYIMTNQNYVYFYRTNPFGYQGWKEASYNTPQNYWFSILNLSMGFESNISNSFSVQVEPYVKMPLKQVGVGNVSLTSYGINLGLKYAPVLKRSRH
jgi:hypothetical protein